jgi:hypothetical protein
MKKIIKYLGHPNLKDFSRRGPVTPDQLSELSQNL